MEPEPDSGPPSKLVSGYTKERQAPTGSGSPTLTAISNSDILKTKNLWPGLGVLNQRATAPRYCLLCVRHRRQNTEYLLERLLGSLFTPTPATEGPIIGRSHHHHFTSPAHIIKIKLQKCCTLHFQKVVHGSLVHICIDGQLLLNRNKKIPKIP